MAEPEDFLKRYRDTIGLFATGVTVILAEKGGDIRGMTANAVTSLSLDPTLLLFCPAKSARISALLELGSSFTVNILATGQEEISNYYAGAETEVDRDYVEWPAAGKVPRLGGCVASLACRVQAQHEGGDHWIVVGEVVDLHRPERPAEPLLFYAGGYRRLDSSG